VSIEDVSDATKQYELHLYHGSGSKEFARIPFDGNVEHPIMIDAKEIPANDAVSGALACSGGNSETAKVKIIYNLT